MTSCPLPIDWLDLLAGRPSDASRAHLDSCPACQAVVAMLDNTPSRSHDVTTLTELDTALGSGGFLIAAEAHLALAAGDIRWLSFEGMPQRLAVLLLEDLDEEFDSGFDIAPLLTDVENALPGDLLLGPADTTTNIPWRVAFRCQTVVDRRYLDGLIGMTTGSGKTAVLAALAGGLPAGLTGTALESDYDPRLRIDPSIEELLEATVVTEDPDFGEETEDATPILQQSRARPSLAGTFRLQLKESQENSTKTQYQLAAAAKNTEKLAMRAYFRDDRLAVSLIALIWYNWRDDQLMMRPETVIGLPEQVQFIVRSTQHSEPVIVDATLQSGEEIVLVADAGISEQDIETLEVQVR